MLHALKEYAAQSDGPSIKPGYKPKHVRWLILFDRKGHLLGVQPTGDSPRQQREFACCPDLSQPEMKAGGKGCRHFLVDSLEVVAMLTKTGDVDAKVQAKHAYFTNLLHLAGDVETDLQPIAGAMADEALLVKLRAALEASGGSPKPTDNATFAIAETSAPILVERTTWHAWWDEFRLKLASKRSSSRHPTGRRGSKTAQDSTPGMRCLMSGELVHPCSTDPKIEGLSDVGGLSMGDALTSFKQPSFCSFGLTQGENAAKSESMAEVYRATLNRLLRDPRHSHKLVGTKVVHWYLGDVRTDEGEDPIGLLLNPADYGIAVPGESTETTEAEPDAEPVAQYTAESQAGKLLDAVRTGQLPPRLKDARYCALTLSANSGRVVVRDWMEGAFEQLAANVDAWFGDLAIVSRDGERRISVHKFAAILAAMVRDLKDVPAPIVTTLWRCAIHKRPIPHEAMAQALARAKVDIIQDEPARHARFALLKAYCNRKEIPMSEGLDPNHPSPAYQCGRLFAVLAYIQYKALGDVGAGIVQRYYAAASATPALILGRLMHTAQFHLSKIEEKGVRMGLDARLGEIWAQLKPNEIPATLTLEEQTLFALGYYHQKAYRGPQAKDANLQEAV